MAYAPHPRTRKECTARCARLIAALGLQQHPEGGYFRETYRSPLAMHSTTNGKLPGQRSVSTGIHFLLHFPEMTMSALHRVAADEMWHFYEGTGLDIHVIDHKTGEYSFHRLGAVDFVDSMDSDELPDDVAALEGAVATLGENGVDSSVKSQPQLTVRAGDWFAATVRARKPRVLVGARDAAHEHQDHDPHLEHDQAYGYCLVGCTVAPGFSYEDFTLANRNELIQRYPDHKEVITRLTRA